MPQPCGGRELITEGMQKALLGYVEVLRSRKKNGQPKVSKEKKRTHLSPLKREGFLTHGFAHGCLWVPGDACCAHHTKATRNSADTM